MSKLFVEKKETHLVFKWDDIERHLSESQIIELARMMKDIRNGRIQEGKAAENEYYVVNKDEPYAAAVFEVIKVCEENKDGN